MRCPVQVFANVDPSKGYKGISCFLVEKEMGVEVAKKEKKVRYRSDGSGGTRRCEQWADRFALQLGIRASSTCVLNFDDIKIPAENLLGVEGQGYKYAIEILNEGRVGIAGQMVGLAQGAFNKVVPYTFQRQQFGQAVGSVSLPLATRPKSSWLTPRRVLLTTVPGHADAVRVHCNRD